MPANPNWPSESNGKPQWRRRLEIVCWCVLIVGIILIFLLQPSPLQPESPTLRVIRYVIIAAAASAGIMLRVMGMARR
jgi:hypothetical protein